MYEFPEDVVSRDENYLNDIVIDVEGGFAYISDSGVGPTGFFGGLVGKSSRVVEVKTSGAHDFSLIGLNL